MVTMETTLVGGAPVVVEIPLVGGASNDRASNLRGRFEDLEAELSEESDLVLIQNCLPDKPEEPIPSDCCGSGCSPCVYDVYHDQLLLWQRLQAMGADERRQFLEERSARAKKSANGTVLSPIQFRKFKVIGIRKMTGDSFLYTFALPWNQTLGAGTGQHIVLRDRDAKAGVVTRSYTPISPANQTGSFDVLIKIYKEGMMTRMVKGWRSGYEAEWKGPFGGLHYTPNLYTKIGMLACGTGIAPMVHVIRCILDNEDDLTTIRLLYACRTQRDILMKDFLDEYSSYWNLRVTYVLSRSGPESLVRDKGLVRYSDSVEFGRIGEGLVRREMPSPSAKALVLVCGTQSFDEDMVKYLVSLGHEQEAIFKF